MANCSAFCVLYEQQQGIGWSSAYLMHMLGGPDPNVVAWDSIRKNMPQAGNSVYYAILANSQETVLSDDFIETVQQQLPFIPVPNTWVYNSTVTLGFAFGLNVGGFAGEPA
jgi:hypothetical protein